MSTQRRLERSFHTFLSGGIERSFGTQLFVHNLFANGKHTMTFTATYVCTIYKRQITAIIHVPHTTNEPQVCYCDLR